MIHQFYTNELNILEHYQKRPMQFRHHSIKTADLYLTFIFDNQFNLQELVYIPFKLLILLKIEIFYCRREIKEGFLTFSQH
jgi:hypothetical protein